MNNFHSFLPCFSHKPAQLVESTPIWFQANQKEAYDYLTQHGLPGSTHENWKYTDISFLQEQTFSWPLSHVKISHSDIKSHFLNPNYHCMVFVDGWFNKELSSIKSYNNNIILTHLNHALFAYPKDIQNVLDNASLFSPSTIVAFNTAFMTDGLFLKLGAGATLEQPLHLLFISTVPDDNSYMQHYRNVIMAEKNSQATVIEHYVNLSSGSYLTTLHNTFLLAQQANLYYYKLQQESKRAYHLSHTEVHQQKESSLASYSIDLGGKLIRNDFITHLDEENSNCTLSGLYIATQKQHIDNHTAILHTHPHCSSVEDYKGILDDRAKAVFNGKVIVYQDAQKTQAQQSNRNLLLSCEAEIDTKPQLEIFANDVQCTHGATVGQLDKNALFYLQSRGVNLPIAKALLTYGFAKDFINSLQLTPIQNRVEHAFIESFGYAQQLKELERV